MPEPLLAPPQSQPLARLDWSSESPRYGGNGTPPLRPHARMHIAGESAVLLPVGTWHPTDGGKNNDDH